MHKGLGCLVLWATVISSVNIPAYADESCDNQLIESIGKYFNIKRFNSGESGVIIIAACKTWPYKNNIAIAAFAYAADPEKKSDITSEKGLLVVTMDKYSRSVISSYRDTIGEDAVTQVGSDSLQLDTARYQLSMDVRAFGLRFQSVARPSCFENTFDNQLTLFVPSGKELRPVFKQFAYT